MYHTTRSMSMAQGRVMRSDILGLEPGSEYRITVHAACDMGLCEGSEELLVTLFKAKE